MMKPTYSLILTGLVLLVSWGSASAENKNSSEKDHSWLWSTTRLLSLNVILRYRSTMALGRRNHARLVRSWPLRSCRETLPIGIRGA